MQVKVSVGNMWVTIFIVIIQVSLCCNYAGGIFCSAICTTVSIVIMQVTVSVVAMYVTVSSNNLIFLSLPDTNCS